jgi:hypothetical protein
VLDLSVKQVKELVNREELQQRGYGIDVGGIVTILNPKNGEIVSVDLDGEIVSFFSPRM